MTGSRPACRAQGRTGRAGVHLDVDLLVERRVERHADLLRLIVDDLDARVVGTSWTRTNEGSLSLTLALVRSAVARKLDCETGTSARQCTDVANLGQCAYQVGIGGLIHGIDGYRAGPLLAGLQEHHGPVEIPPTAPRDLERPVSEDEAQDPTRPSPARRRRRRCPGPRPVGSTPPGAGGAIEPAETGSRRQLANRGTYRAAASAPVGRSGPPSVGEAARRGRGELGLVEVADDASRSTRLIWPLSSTRQRRSRQSARLCQSGLVPCPNRSSGSCFGEGSSAPAARIWSPRMTTPHRAAGSWARRASRAVGEHRRGA